MKYKMNTNANGQRLETIAQQENEILIRIYFNGKFLNYLFDPVDVKELGLSAIFDMIDPDPELANAEALYAQVLDHRQAVLTSKKKKKKQLNSLD
jgi:hypothetical protein